VKGDLVTIHGFCRTGGDEWALRVLAEGATGVKEVRLDFVPAPLFVLARA
jgi:hypothetical protein